MNGNTVGFVGGGRVTRILLEGWQRAGVLPANLVVSDAHPESLAKLSAKFPKVKTTCENTQAVQADVVFLALHPPVLVEVLPAIKSHLPPKATIISLAPKLTFAKLASALGGHDQLVRMIPNAPSLVNSGFNPVTYGPSLDPHRKQVVSELLGALGDCPEVPERMLEAYAVVTAMGPTYFWFQFQKLTEQAVAFGLSPADARSSVAQMIHGTAKILLESDVPPAEILDLVPVKPLQEEEQAITAAFERRLNAIYQKLTT